MPERAYVYIDGFNLYNGAIRGNDLHWLDLVKMSSLLLKGYDVTQVRYFTAIVSDRPGDPQKSLRQKTYLRALATFPNVSIALGQFTTHDKWMPLSDSLKGNNPTPQFVKVSRTDEKGSDVNLATWLLHDAHLNRFDVAAVVSNDSDLVEPIRLIRSELRKRVGVINPHKFPSKELVKNADFVKQLRRGLLADCRLPKSLTDAHGTVHCPEAWLNK